MGIRGKKKKRIPAILLLLLYALDIGLAVVPHMFFERFREETLVVHKNEVQELQNKLGAIKKEVEKLKPYQKELTSYESQKKNVKEKLQVVRALVSTRGTPVNVMDALGQSLPPRTWLESFNMTLGSSSGRLTLEGSSLTNEDVSDYLDKLENSIYLTNVKLSNMKRGKVENNIEIKRFRITATPKVEYVKRTETKEEKETVDPEKPTRN